MCRLVLTQHCSFRYKLTPEILWGILHGVLGLGMVAWWQATVHLAAMARAANRGS